MGTPQASVVIVIPEGPGGSSQFWEGAAVENKSCDPGRRVLRGLRTPKLESSLGLGGANRCLCPPPSPLHPIHTPKESAVQCPLLDPNTHRSPRKNMLGKLLHTVGPVGWRSREGAGQPFHRADGDPEVQVSGKRVIGCPSGARDRPQPPEPPAWTPGPLVGNRVRLRGPNTRPGEPQLHPAFPGAQAPWHTLYGAYSPRGTDGAGGRAVSEPSCCTDVRGGGRVEAGLGRQGPLAARERS